MADRLLSTQQVCELLGIGQRTLARWIASGRMPKPIQLGPRGNRWRLSTVNVFLDQLEQAGTLA